MVAKTLDEVIREEKREYHRNWRAKNRDKIKNNNNAYWSKKAMQKLQAESNHEAGEDNAEWNPGYA